MCENFSFLNVSNICNWLATARSWIWGDKKKQIGQANSVRKLNTDEKKMLLYLRIWGTFVSNSCSSEFILDTCSKCFLTFYFAEASLLLAGIDGLSFEEMPLKTTAWYLLMMFRNCSHFSPSGLRFSPGAKKRRKRARGRERARERKKGRRSEWCILSWHWCVTTCLKGALTKP